jgi:hypothetical protein
MNLHPPPITGDLEDLRRWCEDLYEYLKIRNYNKSLWVPVRLFIPETTGGSAAYAEYEYGTNDVMVAHMAFDKDATERSDAILVMPEDWDLGTIQVKFYWIPGAGASAGEKVRWSVASVAVGNDDAVDGTYSSALAVTDTVTAGATGDLHVTGPVGPITIAGTPKNEDLINLRVSRIHDHADDTMAGDAWLIGILIQHKGNKDVSIWSAGPDSPDAYETLQVDGIDLSIDGEVLRTQQEE